MTHVGHTQYWVPFDARVAQVTCPTCKSAPGQLCVSMYGQAVRWFHPSRLTASIRQRELARSKRRM